jgi:Lipase (class 3)
VILTDAQADARLGALIAPVADMFRAGVLAPAPDPRLSPDWIVRGYITALDAVLPPLGRLQLGAKAYYGVLVESARSPGDFAAVIRGTADTVEWIIDAIVQLVPHHAGGCVEMGFNDLYQSMRYRPAGPPEAPDSSMVPGIVAAVGDGSLTIIGHSLGAACAALATLDFAMIHGMDDRVRGLFFCSPRPGNQAFADAFAANVKNASGWALAGDIVPQVPAGFGYAPLLCETVIGPPVAQSIIKNSRLCFHHIYSILSAMDYSLLDWNAVPAVDQDLTACILGPATV